MLDTHQLNVFLAAADTLNFTQAAQRLKMSQPSVSQHIRSLEQTFGQQLFVRSGRHIALTNAGETLLPLAREMVERSLVIEDTMLSLQGEVHGRLQMICSTTPGKYILPRVLATFEARYPHVQVSCQIGSQLEALHLLCEAAVQIAFFGEPQSACPTAEIRPFLVDPVHLIVPLDHPWAARGDISLDELREGQFVLRVAGSGTQQAVDRALAEAGLTHLDLRAVMELGSSEATALAVMQGVGAGFVSGSVVRELVAGRVAVVGVQGVAFARQIYVGSQGRKPATAVQNAFWRFLEEWSAAESHATRAA